MRSIVLGLLALSLTACADKAPPTWPDDAELETETTANSATVRWPAPEDDHGVVRIVVRMNDSVVAELDGDATSYTAEDLDDETEVRFEVAADDEAGNRSEQLSASARTLDGTGPHWPAGATLMHRDGHFHWSTAQDSTGVESYERRQGATVLTETSSTSFAFEGDPAGCQVVAKDAAGNASAPLAYRTAEEIAAEPTPEALEVAPEGQTRDRLPQGVIERLRQQVRESAGIDRDSVLGRIGNDQRLVPQNQLQQ